MGSDLVTLNTEKQILDLSLRGMTSDQIAEALGIGLGAVQSALGKMRAALSIEYADLIEQHRAVSIARSEGLLRRVMDMIDSSENPRTTVSLIKTALDIMRYQNQVIGLAERDKAVDVKVMINNTITTNDPLYQAAAEIISSAPETYPIQTIPDVPRPILPEDLTDKRLALLENAVANLKDDPED